MNVLAASVIIFDAIKEKHALAERTQLQGDKAKNNSERNAVMVRGRQLEELSPCSPTAPLLFSHYFLVLNNKKKISEQE
jgi:hypothetical protein